MPIEKQRPRELRSVTISQVTDHGTMYITIGYKLKGYPFEVFIAMGNAGDHERAWIEALSRAITTGIRHGVPASVYIDQLRGITCQPVPDGRGNLVRSPADGLARVLAEFCETTRAEKPEAKKESS